MYDNGYVLKLDQIQHVLQISKCNREQQIKELHALISKQ